MICTLCPRNCGGAERAPEHGTGVCRMGTLPKIARARRRTGGEPCHQRHARQRRGVLFPAAGGAVCSARTKASASGVRGKIVTPEAARSIFRELEAQGAHNIIPRDGGALRSRRALDALALYRPSIPIVYKQQRL